MTLPEDRQAEGEETGLWGQAGCSQRTQDVLLLLNDLESSQGSPGES